MRGREGTCGSSGFAALRSGDEVREARDVDHARSPLRDGDHNPAYEVQIRMWMWMRK